MNEQEKQSPGANEHDSGQTDEIGNKLESENEVNKVIEEQGDDAAAGIPRDRDAAKHETHRREDDNQELTGAP